MDIGLAFAAMAGTFVVGLILGFGMRASISRRRRRRARRSDQLPLHMAPSLVPPGAALQTGKAKQAP